MLDMHEVISSSLTVPTKKRRGHHVVPSALFWVGTGAANFREAAKPPRGSSCSSAARALPRGPRLRGFGKPLPSPPLCSEKTACSSAAKRGPQPQALTVPTFMFRKGGVLERSESFAAQPQALTAPTFMLRKGVVLERSESFAEGTPLGVSASPYISTSSPQGVFCNRAGKSLLCLL